MTTPISIFLIDEHRLARAAIRRLLVSKSMKVIGEAGSSQEALTKLSAMGNTFPDIFLLDLCLPDSHGLILFKKIWKHCQRRCRIVILTGTTHPTFRQRCIRHGATGFLTKHSCSAEKLQRAMSITPHYAPLISAQSLPPNPAHSLLEAKIASLSDLQLVLLIAIAEGKKHGQLSEQLGLSSYYIKEHYCAMRKKLGIKNDKDAAYLAIGAGLISPRCVQTTKREDGKLIRIHG